jgi:hypothetical protein
METVVRIFHVSEKNKKFVVGQVEYHVNGAVIESQYAGSLKLKKAGRVGQCISFGDIKLKAMKEKDSKYNRLVLAE